MSIIFVLIIIAAVFWGLNKNKAYHYRKYIFPLKAKWLFGGYFLVLLISVPVFLLIPKEGFLYAESNLSKLDANLRYHQGLEMDNEMLRAAKEKRLQTTDGVVLLAVKSLEFKGEELSLEEINGAEQYTPIMIEIKEENDGNIEASYYSSKIYFNSIDLTDRLQKPDIQLTGDRLIIFYPKKYQLKLYQYQNTINQFEKNKPHDSMGLDVVWGQRILYLRIPQQVRINYGKLNVDFINS